MSLNQSQKAILSVTEPVTDSVTESKRREEKRREGNSYSVPNGTGSDGAKPRMTDPKEIIFGYGLAMLVNAGTLEKHARSFLGGRVKEHGEEDVINCLRECAKARPLQPLEWIAAALPPRNGAGHKLNAQEALEAANRAVGDRFLAGQENPDVAH